MKALGFTAETMTAAPRMPPASFVGAPMASGIALSWDDAVEVLRVVLEDGVDDVESDAVSDLAAEGAANSADELRRRPPATAKDVDGDDADNVANLTQSKSVGLAAFLMKPESESTIHF